MKRTSGIETAQLSTTSFSSAATSRPSASAVRSTCLVGTFTPANSWSNSWPFLKADHGAHQSGHAQHARRERATLQLGAHSVHAVVDPDDADVRERFETDNEASFAIDVRPPPPVQPDLEIRDFTLTPGELSALPQGVTASAHIANTGLDPVPSVSVELFQGHPDLGGVAVTSTVVAVSGNTRVEVGLDFDVATGGTRTFYLRVDGSPVVERDDSNNLALADLRDLMDVVDVSLEPGSIVLSSSSLDPGDLLEVDVRVDNAGTRSLSSVAVALFYELSPGSLRLASTLSVPLTPGASELVRLSWTANRSGTVPLELRVDPNDVLSETNEDDNVLLTSVDVNRHCRT